ncbi:glycoside hydrolase family 5 protein [Cohnella soli]|uniref:Glycoside hydrolase family 5 protein n=1 Tax=Cohnella soli TaxID=425005 RepID=A0ABW0HJV9_9BACL
MTVDAEKFLRAEGGRLVNGAGREVLLRGVGFGSWFLPEGYMWKFPDGGDRPRRIEAMIRELVGEEKAVLFWETYYDRYVTEADIEQIAAEGFNSVRVPLNARFLLDDEGTCREDRLRRIDELLGWCRKHEIYAILDLHGAPGGQTGTNIDDSERDLPELFTDERNRELTIGIWRALAERYKEEWIVAGYDLLNEPLPEWFSSYNDQIMPLYEDIVRSIREVDGRHMIILEGAHWATDWSVFSGEPIDSNVMLQFHKYWNVPDTASIRQYIEAGARWNAPIFMGEGGENNTDWYAGAFRLFEDHHISWNFWTWKKMETTNSPYSVRMPEDWPLLVTYLEGGPKPDAETAWAALSTYLDNLPLDRCDYRPEVVRSLFRQPNARIPAIFYRNAEEGVGFGFGEGSDRRDSEFGEERRRGGGGLGFRDADGTDIRFVDSEREKPNFQHMRGEAWASDEWLCVRLAPGDWLAYDVEVPEVAREGAGLTLRMRGIGGGAGAGDSGTGAVEVLRESGEAGVLEPIGAVRIPDEAESWIDAKLAGRLSGRPSAQRIVIRAAGRSVDVQWIKLDL